MAADEVTRLRNELDEVKLHLVSLQSVVRSLIAEDDPSPAGRYPKAPPTTWHDVEDWVVNMMQDTLERRASNSRRWCPQWYLHTEVLTRFRILYESYREVEALDAISYSTWFLDHLDRHLDIIFSSDGPFAACSPERHAPHRGLTIARNENAEADWGKRPATRTAPPKPPGRRIPSASARPTVPSSRTQPSPVEVKP